ncbi:fibrous sheath CABYR-binding protein-like [Schistocerca cancellata]|uniref:fibrous sheath CABYR-binding protein-like n=1 Tax=Schistocerca cancellata TaxID=274614 RepID=UPI0021177E34|nr:fibrous sheath CABYR-binding protein-like [Schistocerca cancellata]
MGNIAASYHRNNVSPDKDRKIFAAIGGVGVCSALTVIIEMCEKLGGSHSHNWSALRFMGPQIWLPLKTKEDFNVAIIILIFSIMYAASATLLIYAGWNRVKDLSLTWKMVEVGVLIYQMIAAIITANMFSVADSVLLSVDTVLGVLALIYTRIAESAWREEPSRAARRRRRRSPSPSQDEVVTVSEPTAVSSQQARRSLEAVPGPSAVAGPSGVPRPSRAAEPHPVDYIDGDSDSLEEVAAIVELPPPRHVITPRRKKSSVRTAEVTVHSPPPDLQDIAVSTDADESLGSIAEESTSDRSHSSPSTALSSPPCKPTAARLSETILEVVPQGPSTSTAVPASTEPPSVAQAPASQQTSPSTVEAKSRKRKTDAPARASPRTPPPTAASYPPAEAESPRERPVSPGESKTSQQTPSATAGSSSADPKTAEQPSATDTATSSPLPGDGASHSSQTEADSAQATAGAAGSGTLQAETETTGEQPAVGTEVATEARD